MSALAEEIDRALEQLDRPTAESLERLLREFLALAQRKPVSIPSRWPEGYFEQTAGALAGEPLERPPQGQLPERARWRSPGCSS